LSLNQVLLIGRSGRDPELRYLEDGTPVTGFSLAVNSYRRDQSGEQIEDTEWFNVSVWGRQAENINQYLTKGRKVFVEGRLSTREYTTAAGENRLSMEVRAFRVILLDRKESESSSANDADLSDERDKSDQSSNSLESSNDLDGDTVEELPW
tara:strand:+ start:121 stop:576 length:456 start_codon:yes stop_codon:yes gene_type:complete